MLGIGFWEIVLVIIVALIVINPKDLPKIIYHVGFCFAKLQQFFLEVKEQYLKNFVNYSDDNKKNSE